MSTRPDLVALWRRGQHGWPARFPLAQFPNAPLIVAVAGWLGAALTKDPARSYAEGTFYAGLTAWAWAEMAAGVNWFRRVIGVAGLVYVVAKIAESLRG